MQTTQKRVTQKKAAALTNQPGLDPAFSFKTAEDYLGAGLVRAMMSRQPEIAGVMLGTEELEEPLRKALGEKYQIARVGSIGPFPAFTISHSSKQRGGS